MKIDDGKGAAANNKQNKDEVVVFSLKRVMKALNNYILNEYQKLFNIGSKVEDGSRSVKQGEFITNPQLLKKARDELKFCENKQITPEELIRQCVSELESLGFLNMMEGEADQFMYSIRD